MINNFVNIMNLSIIFEAVMQFLYSYLTETGQLYIL